VAAQAHPINRKPVETDPDEPAEIARVEVDRPSRIESTPHGYRTERYIGCEVGLGGAQVPFDSGAKGKGAQVRVVVVRDANTHLEAEIGALRHSHPIAQ